MFGLVLVLLLLLLLGWWCNRWCRADGRFGRAVLASFRRWSVGDVEGVKRFEQPVIVVTVSVNVDVVFIVLVIGMFIVGRVHWEEDNEGVCWL